MRMRARFRLWTLLCAGIVFVFHLRCGAQEAATQVTVSITAVKESDWQQEMAQKAAPSGLRERLHARTLVELHGAANDEKPTILRSGEEHNVVTEWEFDRAKDNSIAKKTVQEFIGTQVLLQQEPPKNHAGATRISLTLTHDLSPLQLQSMSYANAAVGAERERRSVTAPRYERLRWQGEVLVGVSERVIASFLPAKDSDTRIVVFFKGSAGSTTAPMLEVRQTIYRVPEQDILEWLLKNQCDDAAVMQQLQAAVAARQASIVSTAALAVAPHASTEMQFGNEWWLPSESDQVFDRLYLVPVAFSSALGGTRLKVDGSTGAFTSFFSPRAPLAVQWPTSWLRVRDEHGAGSRVIHGWMDWYDRFEQEIVGTTFSASASPQIVAIMPPADQTWGTDRKGRWLDVTVIKLSGEVPKPASQPAKTEPADPFAPPSHEFFPGWMPQPATMRSLILGIALDSKIAHELLAVRQPEKDAILLSDLMARVKSGEARMVTSAFAAHNSNCYAQTSARIHAYPTEMPSVASAWEDEPVGTLVEQEGATMALTQHLAPPARTEWKLALDVPEAIMWEPRFRKFSFMSTTAALTTPGTHLLAAASVPGVMASADLPANETLFLFKHLDAKTATPATTRQDVEIETLTFEIPAQDAAAWQAVKSDDFEAFTRQHLQSGRAKLQSQTLLRTQPVPWARMSIVEEYLTATEFDPPSVRAPSRMRPTALQMLPVGLQLKTYLSAEDDGTFVANLNLQQSVAKPIEPSLEETLRISADANTLYPGAKHEIDKWADEEMRIPPGLYHCLGILPPRGGGAGTSRIGFMRIRPAP